MLNENQTLRSGIGLNSKPSTYFHQYNLFDVDEPQPTSQDFPSKYNILDSLPSLEIFNQLALNDCVAVSGSFALYVALYKKAGIQFMPSVKYGFYAGRIVSAGYLDAVAEEKILENQANNGQSSFRVITPSGGLKPTDDISMSFTDYFVAIAKKYNEVGDQQLVPGLYQYGIPSEELVPSFPDNSFSEDYIKRFRTDHKLQIDFMNQGLPNEVGFQYKKGQYKLVLDEVMLKLIKLDNSQELVKKLKELLVQDKTIMFGMSVDDSQFWKKDSALWKEGLFSLDNGIAQQQNYGHAMVIVGFDDEKVIDSDHPDRKGAFIVRNSWGVAFGDHGYWYLPYQLVYTFPQPPFFNSFGVGFVYIDDLSINASSLEAHIAKMEK
ncbi:C1 family peptidase [Microscilla marina]|nr:C1 family peptidase [Microscilla marina]